MSHIQKPPTTGYRFVILAVILPSSFTLELKCGRPLNSVQQYTVRFAVLFEMFNALHSNLFLIDITTKKNLVKVEIRVILNFMLCNSILDSIKNLRAYASLGMLVVTVPSPAMRYACVRVGKSRCLNYDWCISESFSIRVSHVVGPAYIGTDYDCVQQTERI